MNCVIPMGSFEQHGPFLPPTVDTEIATHVAKRIGESLGARVLEPVWYSCSHEHIDFPPTISVPCETFADYAKAVIKGALKWCERVLVVAGHGGIADIGNAVASQLNYELGPRVLWINIWSLAPVRDHAGSDEASIYLAIGGRMTAVPDKRICEGDVHLMRYLRTSWMSKSGIVGCIDPAEISEERGRSLLETIVYKALEKANTFLTATREIGGAQHNATQVDRVQRVD